MDENLGQSQKFYEDYFEEGWDLCHHNKQRYKKVYSLISNLQFRDQARVIDIGSGSGRITHFLDERFEKVVSFDITKTNLMDETLSETNSEFVKGALPNLPFQDGSFDLTVCSEVIEHIPTQDKQLESISEIANVLTPGGYLVLSTPNPKSIYRIIQNLVLDSADQVTPYVRDDGGQIVENWIRPETLSDQLEGELKIKKRLGSYYAPPDFINGVSKPFHRVSDFLTDRGSMPDRGLYQYYVAQKPTGHS